ncbi:hypothetical protein M378DRAFT_158841 [Amanita muscaria Koide BX008]|uniref:Uncharacterized protein n=1 Tax=Amanita muscaria (strain Koide BX008) TaxID=946122 RepID=A0A0C2X2D1_AMAMK|nr:hypothetical protein M378DRAFT_158841 [Amanita muscaria Koide BX008]
MSMACALIGMHRSTINDYVSNKIIKDRAKTRVIRLQAGTRIIRIEIPRYACIRGCFTSTYKSYPFIVVPYCKQSALLCHEREYDST